MATNNHIVQYADGRVTPLGEINPFFQNLDPLQTLTVQNKTWDSVTGDFTFTFDGELQNCIMISPLTGATPALIDGNKTTYNFSEVGNGGNTFESDFQLLCIPAEPEFFSSLNSFNFVVTSADELYADEGRESTSSEILIKINPFGDTQTIYGDGRPENIDIDSKLQPDNFYTPTVTDQQQEDYENGAKGVDLYINPTPLSNIFHKEGSETAQQERTDNALNPILDLRSYFNGSYCTTFKNDSFIGDTTVREGPGKWVNILYHDEILSVIMPDEETQYVFNIQEYGQSTAVFGQSKVSFTGNSGADTVVLSQWAGYISIYGGHSNTQGGGLDTVWFNFSGREFTDKQLKGKINGFDVLHLGSDELIPLTPEDTVNGDFTLNFDVGASRLLTEVYSATDNNSYGTLVIKGDSGDTINFSGGILLKLKSSLEGYDRYVEKDGNGMSDNEYYIDSDIIVNSVEDIIDHTEHNHDHIDPSQAYLDITNPLADVFF